MKQFLTICLTILSCNLLGQKTTILRIPAAVVDTAIFPTGVTTLYQNSLKEDKANKAIDFSVVNNTKYPSVQAVVDYIGTLPVYTIPNLQSVTTAGSNTSHSIVSALNLQSVSTGDAFVGTLNSVSSNYVYLKTLASDDLPRIVFKVGAFGETQVRADNADGKTLQLPNITGTLANAVLFNGTTYSASTTGLINMGAAFDTTAGIHFDATFTPPGTTGSQTINKPAGSVNFAAGAISLTVTNSLVTTTSIIMVTVEDNDTAVKSAYVSSKSAGSFTLKLNANAAAETKVTFIVF